MRIPKIKELRNLFRERHTKRGYYDFMKASLGILVSAFVLVIFLYDVLEKFELTTFDYRMKLRRKRAANPAVVLVDMGEDSIQKIGRWPWPREWHATMITALARFGAKAAVFDVIFSEPAGDLGDAAMEEAMAKSGNVYIPSAVELERYNEKKKAWDVRNVISPLERFSLKAKGKGHVTIVPDSDGTIRRIPLIIEHKGRAYPQLGFRVACNAVGIDPAEYRLVTTPFGRYIKVGTRNKIIRVPVDEKNQMIVNWAAKWGSDFNHYSYIDVISSYQKMLGKEKPLIDLNVFKDKICVIGLTAAGLFDIKPNPLQPAYPAVGTNANIINSVLNKDFIKKASRWFDALLIVILGLFVSMNTSRAQPVRGVYTAAWMAAAYLLISYLALDLLNIWISVIYPLIAIILGYLVIALYNQIIISLEKAKLYTLATKDGLTGLFVIRHFNLLLDAEMERTKLRRGRLSILMSDIDHFKKLNDEHGHQAGDFILREVAAILMSCCRQLDVPSRYGGEEFIVMLPGADVNEAAVVAERIRNRVEGHDFRMGDKTYKITISLGVAAFNGEATMAEFVKKADDALYRAKEEGRNRVSIACL